MTEVLMWHSKKPRRLRLRGFSIPFWVGGLIPRLATSYSSPSNHSPENTNRYKEFVEQTVKSQAVLEQAMQTDEPSEEVKAKAL